MDIYNATLTFLAKEKKNEEKSLQYLHQSREDILIGGVPTDNVRITDAETTICRIYVNSSQKIAIENVPDSGQIFMLNGKPIETKALLKSGDVISVLGANMRWETDADLKHRKSLMTKSARKEQKHKYLKTTKRVTIHSLKSFSGEKSSTQSIDSEGNSPSQNNLKNNDEPVKIENVYSDSIATNSLKAGCQQEIEQESAAVELNSPPSINKENLKTPKKVNANLNLSGTLVTSYTPSSISRRSVSKVSTFETPERSLGVKRDILKESPIKSNSKTPSTVKSASKPSMHLVDLVATPTTKKASTSTPRDRSVQKQSGTVGKTPSRNENILLKSALKNSSIKKNQDRPIIATTSSSQVKKLFTEDLPIGSGVDTLDSSSVIEISMASESPIEVSESDTGEMSVITIRDTLSLPASNLSLQNETPGSQSSDDEMKNLIQSIDNVLEGENDNTEDGKNISALLKNSEIVSTPERDFNEIVDNSKVFNVDQSLFDQATIGNVSELDSEFNKIIGNVVEDNGEQREKDPVLKKGEDVIKWIESAKEAIQTESTKTTQILSSRYSNVTPNDSIVDTTVANVSTRYDVKTPKLSILDTVGSLRKSDIEAKLAKSPVSRLSIGNNSTEVVENYMLNSDNSKSLRSTRKRIGSAIASMLNSSSVAADTTIDANESLNLSVQQDANQSQMEIPNILSLDDQAQQSQTYDSVNVNAEISIPLNFIKFADHDDECNTNKEVYEINIEGDNIESNGQEENDESESEDESESSSEDEIDQDEYENDIIDENIGSNQKNHDIERKSCIQFRLSKQDLEEEGIQPLEISKTEEELQEVESEHVEYPETQPFDISKDDLEDPEKTLEMCNDSLVNDNFKNSVSEVQPEMSNVETPLTIKLEPSMSFVGKLENDDDTNECVATAQSELNEISNPIQSNELSRNRMLWRETRCSQESNESASTNGYSQIPSQNSNMSPVSINIIESQKSGDTLVDSLDSQTVDEQASEGSSQQSLEPISSNVDNTINELIGTPTDNLINIASARQPSLINESVQEITNEDMNDDEILCPGTQAFGTEEFEEKVKSSAELSVCNQENDEEEIIPGTQQIVDEKNIDSEKFNHEEFPATPESIRIEENNYQVLDSTNNDSAIASQMTSVGNESKEGFIDESNVEFLDETKEEHVTSSFLENYKQIINQQEDKKVDDEPKSHEEITNDKLNDTEEVPINKSVDETIEGEYLEGSSFFNNSQTTKLSKQESELFSETEFSHVEITSVLNRLKSDESPEQKIRESVNKESRESEVFIENPREMEEKEEKQETEIIGESATKENENDIDEYPVESPDEEIIEEAFISSVNSAQVDQDLDVNNEVDVVETNIDESAEIGDISPKENEKDIDDKKVKSNIIETLSNDGNNKESSKDIQNPTNNSQEDIKESSMPSSEEDNLTPVVEEKCVKKFAYVTTNDESTPSESLLKTPSQRRVARVNYSELAFGSPARTRKARSVSVESVKIEKQVEIQSTEMETIVEDDISMKITVHASKSNDIDENATNENQVQNDEGIKAEKEDENKIIESSQAEEIIEITGKIVSNEQVNADKEKEKVEGLKEESMTCINENYSIPDEVISLDSDQDDKVMKKSSIKDLSKVDIQKPAEIMEENVIEASEKENQMESEIIKEQSIDEIYQNDFQTVTIEKQEKLIEQEKTNEKVDTVVELPAPSSILETPSKRRVARVNYSELATGSPARSKRARSASIESSKEEKETIKVIKMKTILEESVSIKEAGDSQTATVDKIEKIDAVMSEPLQKQDEVKEQKHEAIKIPQNLESTPKITRSRKLERIAKQDTHDVATPTRSMRKDSAFITKESETPSSSKTDISTPKNKRGRKANLNIAVSEAIPKTNEQKQDEVISISSEESGQNSNSTPKTKGRKEKVVEQKPEIQAKKVRGRKGKQNIEITEEAQVIESAKPSPKRSREEEIEEKEMPSTKRGKRAAEKISNPPEKSEASESSPITKKGKTRRGQTDESKTKEQKIIEDKKSDEFVPKKGRGRQKAKEVDALQAPKEEEKEVAKGKRALRGKTEEKSNVSNEEQKMAKEEEIPAKKGRARKHKIDQEESAQKVESEDTSPKRSRRGKSKDVEIKVELLESLPKRGRGKKATNEIESLPSKNESDSDIIESTKSAPKRGRGKKAQEMQTIPEEKVSSETSETFMESDQTQSKRGRGRNAKEVESKVQESVTEASSPKRGGRTAKRAESKDVESTPVEEKQLPKKNAKGRKNKEKLQEVATPVEDVVIERKVRGKTPLEKVTKHVTIVTPSQMSKNAKKNQKVDEKAELNKANETVEEAKSKKRAEKRTAAKAVEEAPISKRPTRSRK